MTYGPPPDPNASPPPAHAQLSWHGPTGPVPPGPPPPHAQQSWHGPAGPVPPGGPPPVVEPAKGFGLAVAAVILGVLGIVLPLLPANLDGVRQYIAAPLGAAGLALGIVGCTGNRRGKGLAVAGAILSGLALILGMYMLVSFGLASS